MSGTARQQHLRRYVQTEAMLKHMSLSQDEMFFRDAGAEWFLSRLIEHVNRPQHQKWREYAQARNSRADGTPRMDVA